MVDILIGLAFVAMVLTPAIVVFFNREDPATATFSWRNACCVRFRPGIWNRSSSPNHPDHMLSLVLPVSVQ